jgi:hypothetical protein
MASWLKSKVAEAAEAAQVAAQEIQRQANEFQAAHDIHAAAGDASTEDSAAGEASTEESLGTATDTDAPDALEPVAEDVTADHHAAAGDACATGVAALEEEAAKTPRGFPVQPAGSRVSGDAAALEAELAQAREEACAIREKAHHEIEAIKTKARVVLTKVKGDALELRQELNAQQELHAQHEASPNQELAAQVEQLKETHRQEVVTLQEKARAFLQRMQEQTEERAHVWAAEIQEARRNQGSFGEALRAELLAECQRSEVLSSRTECLQGELNAAEESAQETTVQQKELQREELSTFRG